MFDDGHEPYLVFTATMDSDYPEDADRVFAVHWYLEDKTVMILEKKDPRKGIQGGRFLARMKVKNPKTQEFYDDDAFYVGATITCASRDFHLKDAPEYTLCQMEAHPNRFPQADLRYAVNAIRTGPGCEAVRGRFEEKDSGKTGTVPAATGKQILEGYAGQIGQQAVITLLRRFTEKGQFDYGDMLRYAAQI